MPKGIYDHIRVGDEKRYKIDLKNGCWNYTMSIAPTTGYGQYSKYLGKGKYKNVSAHQYFYEKYNGKVPVNKELDHICRNRKCVNPKHLEPVSAAENVRRGEKTKLTSQKVKQIRNMYKQNTKQYTLANIFGVNQSQISRIVNNLRWN